ncbi:hypothetical protein A4R44_09349 [Amycolatopsis sp. M39]|nr:hypothetical protein A4R44_09349 [Amycolatopsis sp. M39]
MRSAICLISHRPRPVFRREPGPQHGRDLAGVQSHVGRQSHDVTRQEAWGPPKSPELTWGVLGIHDGAVYAATGPGRGAFVASRWTPGAEPMDLAVHRRDPLSGTQLREEARGLAVFTSSGERQEAAEPYRWRFVPGGGIRSGTIRPPWSWSTRPPGQPPSTRFPRGVTSAKPCRPHRSGKPPAPWSSPSRTAFGHFDRPEIAGYRPFPIEPVLAGGPDAPGRRPRGDDPERLPDPGTRTRDQRRAAATASFHTAYPIASEFFSSGGSGMFDVVSQARW